MCAPPPPPQEAFDYGPTDIAYPPVNRFRIAWFNHYHTKSLTEYDRKNSRGDVLFGDRPWKGIPQGTDDVLNLHVIVNIRHRLGRLLEAGAGSVQVSEWAHRLEDLLLRGAPSPDAVGPMLAQHPAPFTPHMVEEGEEMQRSGKWPDPAW